LQELNYLDAQLKAFNKYGKFDFTLHENMFAVLCPTLKRQVTFGTGKGGLEKWGSKKFTADFFNEKEKIVYEIDGNSHKNERNRIVDRIKTIFLETKGICVVRITNEQVEKMFTDYTRQGGEILERFING